MHSSSQSSPKVRGTGEDVAKMAIPHELITLLLDQSLNLLEPGTESSEDLLHVATFLHTDDTSVVLLIHPDKEIFLVVVPDSTSIWPVSSHARGKKERRDRLIEKEVILQRKSNVIM